MAGFDKVNIGGATATRQAVEIATQVSGSFIQDTTSDGLVGLAFSSINTILCSGDCGLTLLLRARTKSRQESLSVRISFSRNKKQVPRLHHEEVEDVADRNLGKMTYSILPT
ncbi:hypothetical protein M433DRAFT_8519 [Acidomyces richmondensis BFW]|nr:hypothetical protein M433DRAFT_8519 [Acidomyces richmondensis BFW]